MALELNYLLNNRYKILEILGQGGMGSVYRATDLSLDLDVAVKDNLFTSDEYSRQFRREAEILAKLRHENMPRVTDYFEIENQGQYLVMDYIEGEDLRQRMDRLGILPDEEVITIGLAVCEALTYLESRTPPVVHRDVKPGNIKITPTGHIFLVDFGLVKTLRDSQITETGARAMTPGYSPPEQYGTARTDQRSDIYSLGATLYAALTGAIPEDSLARAMNQETLTPIRKHNQRVSRRLGAAIENSLEVLPENRYQSADEFRQALLSARSISRRHDELLVEPPPIPEVIPDADEFQENGKTADISDQVKPKIQPGARWTIIILSAVIILLLGIIALTRNVFFQPSWAADFSRMMYQVSQATPGTPVAWYAPWLGGVSISIARATPTGTALVTLTQTATLTPSPTQNASPTVTLTFTSTPLPTLTMTPVPTPLGGGGGQIAFASKRSGMSQIYVVNMDGTGLLKVTDLQDGACQPSWSPDGLQLVFITPCDGNQESYPGAALFTINADGSNLTPLPSVFGGDFDPAWSPDGKKIAFTSMRDNGRTGIYMINLADQSVEVISPKYGRDRQPYWSADGSEIIFVSDREGNSQIWVMSADGSNQRRFSETPDRINMHPGWSPDHKLVLFTQFLAEGSIPQLAVATYGIQPYQEYKMILEQSPMRDGRFSPDGYWVGYEGWPAGNNHDVYIMTLNGSERQALASNPALDYDPAWKPIP